MVSVTTLKCNMSQAITTSSMATTTTPFPSILQRHKEVRLVRRPSSVVIVPLSKLEPVIWVVTVHSGVSDNIEMPFE